jgi:hypothetical protein
MTLVKKIKDMLKEYQDEIDFYNNQIKKVVKSKDIIKTHC